MSIELSPDSILVALKDQVSTPIHREVVLLHLKTGKYYSLNRVGSLVWEQLQSPKTLGEVVEGLVAQFRVERSRCEMDVRRLVSDLVNAGFVEVR